MHVHLICALFIKFITSWISFTPMTIWLTAVSFCDNIYLFHELVLMTSHQRLVHNTPIITPLVLKNFNGMYISRKTITFDSRRWWRRASWERYLTGEWLKLEVWKLRNRKLACTKDKFLLHQIMTALSLRDSNCALLVLSTQKLCLRRRRKKIWKFYFYDDKDACCACNNNLS